MEASVSSARWRCSGLLRASATCAEKYQRVTQAIKSVAQIDSVGGSLLKQIVAISTLVEAEAP